jgi:hypothetical protein
VKKWCLTLRTNETAVVVWKTAKTNRAV